LPLDIREYNCCTNLFHYGEKTVKKSEYFKETLVSLQQELIRETKDIDGLKRILNKSRRAGWKSLTPLKDAIVELETKRGYIAKAIQKIEEVSRKKN
jgi:hypothetical protein